MTSRVPKLCHCPKQTGLNSLYYLRRAKQACSEHNFTKAYEYFVNYFENLSDPSQSSTEVQMAFTELVCKIGTVLEETDNIEELLKCYLKAINLFPKNHVISNNLGAYMFKVGQIDIARKYLELAVKEDSGYLPAEKNLMHVKWQQIPRWHFRMLNDKRRNSAYDRAITETISKGYNNVIDVGAGCGLLSLLASQDPSATITAIEENKTLHKMCSDIFKENNVTNVNLLNCYSTDLTDPPCKCNLIVTEIFDVALFGERALESIFHALTVLRTEEDYRIIPCGAKLYVTGISSDELARKHWYHPRDSQEMLNLGKCCIKQTDSEPYEGEYLSERSFEYMTDIQELFHINFYNRDQLFSMLNESGNHRTLRLKCKKGIVQALVVWFDLNLTEEISITTNPLREDRVGCWEQAIFYLKHPVSIEEGETLELEVSVTDCKLIFTAPQRHLSDHQCFEVSKEIISFMNDTNLTETITKLADKFNQSNLTVVDGSIFPLFGFLMAKNNTVFHLVKNDADIPFFKHILTINDIPVENFRILNQEVSRNITIKDPNIYFFDPISTDGSLDNILFRKDNKMSKTIKIPQVVKVCVQLIYSAYIDHCNKLKDENVLGFKMEKFMNEYTGHEHPNLEHLQYTECSIPVTFTLDGDGEKICDVIVTKNGLINLLYFWYDVQFYEDVTFSTLNSSHYKKSCYFLDNPKVVKLGDTFKIIMKTHGSYFKFSLQ